MSEWRERFLSRLERILGKRKKRRRARYPSYHRRPRGFKAFVKRAALWGLAAAALLVILFSINLPNIDNLDKFVKARSVLIKAEDGRIIGSFGDIYGDYVPYPALPASLIDAVVATEDRNFYHHFGIDPFGMARAMVANVKAKRIVQGGSTITQQVAKNVFLTPERSFTRKIREMLLAMKLESRFTKQEILSIYLNRVYLGAGNYGVDAAAKRYFGISARQLNLSESAILAGLLKAPSRFAPTSNPVLSKQRAEQVLLNMLDAGYLTQEQCDKARAELTVAMATRKRSTQSTMYFADWIMDQLPEFVGNVEQDLVVTATLDTDMQAVGDKAIADIMDKDAATLEVQQAALVAMTPDGAVRAMIGGRSYGGSQFNRATQALRQPGSAFKLFVYLAGLESGITPDTTVEDQPISLPTMDGMWEPHNYTGKYLGTMPLREAVAQSVNTVAVQVAESAGLDHVIDVAKRLGITSDIAPLHSIALGSVEVNLLELTAAYAHMAANGNIVYPYGILQIDTVNGDNLYTRQASSGGIVLKADVVGMMNEMLMGVIDHGTGRAANIGRPAAGKTGTTSDYRDAWFMGYTPDLVAGVWVGNDNNTPMKKVTGGMLPARIWHDFMQTSLANVRPHDIPTGWSVPSPMPWQADMSRGRGRLPWQNEGAAQVNEGSDLPRFSMPSAAPPKRDVKLGQSFWDKLMR